MGVGVISNGTYIPSYRLERSSIAAALPGSGGKGARAVAAYDEDTTSLGVEAARIALRRAPAGLAPTALYFATSAPAYLDKTNATAIHAALSLDASIPAYDLCGSVRSGMAAVRAGLDHATAGGTALVVVADIRIGNPGSSDEQEGGDAAAALLIGSGDEVILEFQRGVSRTLEFFDRGRIPGETGAQLWEERFGEYAYLPLGTEALAGLLGSNGSSNVSRLVIAGPHMRAVRSVRSSFRGSREAIGDDFVAQIGNTGAAHPWLLLCDAIDRSSPGDTVAVLCLADGADALLFKVTPARELAAARLAAGPSVADQLGARTEPVGYTTYLTWRGIVEREPPRRPDPDRPAPPPSLRSDPWKFALVGSTCTVCGMRNLPPQRVCARCRAVDQMRPERLVDVPATIATYTIDRLAFSLSPPVIAAAVDFDGGGRFQCELADATPEDVKIGTRVEMTFRRMYTARGVHNYFWKARPVRTVSVEGK
jgi:3-hydroxy-3-methylglutaryl CoA synthase/uncharacterized OB-fold protein